MKNFLVFAIKFNYKVPKLLIHRKTKIEPIELNILVARKYKIALKLFEKNKNIASK